MPSISNDSRQFASTSREARALSLLALALCLFLTAACGDSDERDPRPKSDESASSRVSTKASTNDNPPLDAAAIRAGARVYKKSGCALCHSKDRKSRLGPGLGGIALRMDRDTLKRWTLDPKAMKPDTTMPAYQGSEEDLEILLDYILDLP